MRSTPENIVPFRVLAAHSADFEDINRFGRHPAYQWGGNVSQKHREKKYWGRKEVVDTYLNLKRQRGGDPILSTAVQLGQDWRMVEKVLDVELGRMPGHVMEDTYYGCNGDQPIRAWEEHQKMLNKKYGPVVIK